MNKTEAKKIAETITNTELLAMLDKAKENIKDWTVVSTCNKGMSKGTAWNILASDFDLNKHYYDIVKVNLVREFGEYLPQHGTPIKKETQIIKIVHQEPNFKNYEINNKKP